MKTMRRLGVVAAAVFGLVAVAVPASAHVTVNPSSAVQGGYARLAFRVPNESDTDSTTRLEVHLPEDAPVASVMTSPVPGWTATVTKRKLDKPIEVHGSPVSEVVSVVTWVATADAAIKPGQFQEFPISLGPLPTVDQMVFKALQTYSDGTVVRWIDEPAGDGTEAESPAPVLKLTAATTTGAAAQTTAAATVPLAQDGKADGGSGWTGVAGLVAGVLALILAGLALARTRKPTGTA
ncbi:membrane protein [Catellatospora sp. TT07R-123]|uniref:YcnI family copper-binding membrane protein n=1 Tax=Catellatospora sp. TT07R-123 TaxID=2733863 RepID=UPI001B296AAE|nr:YcnI family protein [Catellatospora sp. TT07R-123]GHJ45675.1 membrane protein [Catellatospora sp. TT07R-123]